MSLAEKKEKEKEKKRESERDKKEKKESKRSKSSRDSMVADVVLPVFTRPKEGFISLFEAQYIGSVSTTNNGGADAILACIKAVLASPSKDQPGVQLVISAEGVDIEEAGPKDPITGSTATAVAGKVLRHVPIRQIAFVKEDSKNKRIVGFISSDPKTGLLLCHVFNCDSGLAVSEAITKSFKLAAQLRTDPFAVNREGPETPEAVSAEFVPLQVDRKDLKVKMIIGHGQYGKVYLAQLGTKGQVAVKLIKVDASAGDEADFLGEARMLLNFDHPRLLKVAGVCLEKKPWLLIADYMQYKDLGVVLRQCLKLKIVLQANETLSFALQVAEGLDHLLSRRFIHRDIAARNVLLDANNVVKIADFGLTRQLPDGQDFWKLDKAGRLPVKYMSIESLTLKRFSSFSDVWAFGVYMWELLSYAETPWEAERVENTEVRQALIDGKRLSCPQHIHATAFGDDPDGFTHAEDLHNRIFAVAASCWLKEMTERPTMSQLVQSLSTMLTEENPRCEPARDIGLECYRALEANRGRSKAHGERGGSVIRSRGVAEAE